MAAQQNESAVDNEMDAKKRCRDDPEPLKFMIATGLHLLSWTVVIFLSIFPIPVFIPMLLLIVIPIRCIAKCYDKCAGDSKTMKRVFLMLSKPEIIVGISMIINFILCVVAVKIPTILTEIPYHGKIEVALSAIPFLWKVAVCTFMITFSILIIYEGIFEIVVGWKRDKNNGNKYKDKYPYQKIVFSLLLNNEDDLIDALYEKRSKRTGGLVFHYALIACVVAITLAMIVKQINTAISNNEVVSIVNVWIWCSLIYTNANVGFVFISRITIFMVKYFVYTSYYDGCKTCKDFCFIYDDDEPYYWDDDDNNISMVRIKNNDGNKHNGNINDIEEEEVQQMNI